MAVNGSGAPVEHNKNGDKNYLYSSERETLFQSGGGLERPSCFLVFLSAFFRESGRSGSRV